MVIFLEQGSKEIKKHFKPEELVFTVDDVICGAVGQAIEKYDKAVSFFMKMKSTIVIAHTFCASPDTRISFRQCLLILGYFCAV